MKTPQEKPMWRVGNHQKRNIYCGDEYMGVFFDETAAALVVDRMNAHYERLYRGE